MLEDFVKQLEKKLELETPIFEEEGEYQLPVGDGVIITFSEMNDGGYRFFCQVVPCPNRDLEEFFTNALSGNLFGIETERCVLGLDQEGKNVVLSREIPYDTNYQEFEETFEDFFNAIDVWQERALHPHEIS